MDKQNRRTSRWHLMEEDREKVSSLMNSAKDLFFLFD
jgi:hypothetical protein